MPVSGHEPHPNELGFRAVRSGPFGCFRTLRIVKIGCRNKAFGHIAHGAAPCRTASQIWHAICDDVWISSGGVLVGDGAIIGEGCNRPIALHDSRCVRRDDCNARCRRPIPGSLASSCTRFAPGARYARSQGEAGIRSRMLFSSRLPPPKMSNIFDILGGMVNICPCPLLQNWVLLSVVVVPTWA